MDLSVKDRLILWNQYSILEALQPEEADHYRKLKTILENGYKLHYDDMCPHIDREEFDAEDAREVICILGMFEVIQDSIREGSVEGVADWSLQFAGFDGNHEVDQLGYLRFLVEQQDRFRHVIRDGRYNSHAPLLNRYREMLERYQELGSPMRLTEEQIRIIASGEEDAEGGGA